MARKPAILFTNDSKDVMDLIVISNTEEKNIYKIAPYSEFVFFVDRVKSIHWEKPTS